MIWLAQLLVAQAAVQPQPDGPLATAIYVIGGLMTLFGADKVAFWVSKFRGRNGNGNGNGDSVGKLVRATERVAEAVERLDGRIQNVHDICTRLEDRSR